MIQALLFDLDGTLINNDPLHYQAWQKILLSYDVEIDKNFYKQRISGKLNPDIVKDLLPHLPLSKLQDFIEEKEANYRLLAKNIKPLAGLKTLLAWAKIQELKLALVTNAPRENTQFTLGVLGLETTFATIVLGEDVVIGKPDPTPYRVALEQLDLTPDKVIAFEDSPSGIRSAVNAGIFTVGIASTHAPDNLTQVGAKLVVPDFTDLQLWALLK